MPAQTQESKRAGMDAFLDIYEEFETTVFDREAYYKNYTTVEIIALFSAYIGRME